MERPHNLRATGSVDAQEMHALLQEMESSLSAALAAANGNMLAMQVVQDLHTVLSSEVVNDSALRAAVYQAVALPAIQEFAAQPSQPTLQRMQKAGDDVLRTAGLWRSTQLRRLESCHILLCLLWKQVQEMHLTHLSRQAGEKAAMAAQRQRAQQELLRTSLQAAVHKWAGGMLAFLETIVIPEAANSGSGSEAQLVEFHSALTLALTNGDPSQMLAYLTDPTSGGKDLKFVLSCMVDYCAADLRPLRDIIPLLENARQMLPRFTTVVCTLLTNIDSLLSLLAECDAHYSLPPEFLASSGQPAKAFMQELLSSFTSALVPVAEALTHTPATASPLLIEAAQRHISAVEQERPGCTQGALAHGQGRMQEDALAQGQGQGRVQEDLSAIRQGLELLLQRVGTGVATGASTGASAMPQFGGPKFF